MLESPSTSNLLPWSHSSLPQDDFWPVRMLRWRFFIALILCPFSKILFLTPLVHLFCHGKRPLFLPCRALIPWSRWRIDLFNYLRSCLISNWINSSSIRGLSTIKNITAKLNDLRASGSCPQFSSESILRSLALSDFFEHSRQSGRGRSNFCHSIFLYVSPYSLY